MSKTISRWIAIPLCAGLLVSAAWANAQENDAAGFERTPPRLSFTDGEVSFLRPGADDWTPARVNTALASGDQLYTAQRANLELQIGARAFARAGENTQLGLTSLEPDFLQLRVTSGHVSLDLRSLTTGQSLELDTPNAAFTVERSGYYRVTVDGETTTFTSRRGGRATVTPAAGESATVGASEQVVVTGGDSPQMETYAAPELDAWDRWNYARTDDQLDAVSARYVPPGVYGVDDLDHSGDWRVVPSYGAVWVPRNVAAGWAPYSTGRWIYDPYYGWTWVDDAPWGWAPYHYGRWVQLAGYWGWCPGPIVRRPYYAPALVAFFGGGGVHVGVTIGTPYVGWVALGWGEPLIPWWGPAHFRGSPHWAGWGGPRVVNNVVINHTTVYNVKEINVYQNAHVRNAIVAVDRDHFGRRSREAVNFTHVSADRLAPLHGDPGVRPDRSSLVADASSAKHPPHEDWQRSVVATRAPRVESTPELESHPASRTKPERGHAAGAEPGAPDSTPPARVVQPTREGGHIQASRRPPFGTQSQVERSIPSPGPRYVPREAAPEPAPPVAREASPAPTPPAPETRHQRGASSARREEAPAPPRELPGEPANRVYRQQSQHAEHPGHQESTAHASPPAAPAAAQPQPKPQGGERSNGGRSRRGGGGDSGVDERGSPRDH